MTTGDLVRITAGLHAGMTATVKRVGIADCFVTLTSTGITVAVPMLWLRREDTRPMSAAEARGQVGA